jgi:hypothetical protein
VDIATICKAEGESGLFDPADSASIERVGDWLLPHLTTTASRQALVGLGISSEERPTSATLRAAARAAGVQSCPFLDDYDAYEATQEADADLTPLMRVPVSDLTADPTVNTQYVHFDDYVGFVLANCAASQPAATGTMVFSFTIDQSGLGQNWRRTGGTLDAPAIEHCALDAFGAEPLSGMVEPDTGFGDVHFTASFPAQPRAR